MVEDLGDTGLMSFTVSHNLTSSWFCIWQQKRTRGLFLARTKPLRVVRTLAAWVIFWPTDTQMVLKAAPGRRGCGNPAPRSKRDTALFQSPQQRRDWGLSPIKEGRGTSARCSTKRRIWSITNKTKQKSLPGQNISPLTKYTFERLGSNHLRPQIIYVAWLRQSEIRCIFQKVFRH